MKSFPKKCRQRRADGDLLFISLPKDGGGYRREYLGRWSDLCSHAEYERQKSVYAVTGAIERSEGVITIFDLADQFLTWARGYYVKRGKPTAEAKNLLDIIKPVVELFGPEPVKEFCLKKIKTIQSQMDESGRFCRNTINKRIHRIRTMFRWGAENELVPLEVVTSISLLRPFKNGRCNSPDRPSVVSVPMEVVAKTLPYLSSVVADMVRIQLLTGCRPEEVRIMRPCDFDRLTPDLWKYRPEHDKTEHLRRPGEKRGIPISPQGISILLTHSIMLTDDSQEYVFRPVDAVVEKRRNASRKTKKSSSQVESDRDRAEYPKERFKEYYDPRAYGRAIDRAAKRVGVPHWTPYQLRHTAAMEVEKAFGWRAAQVYLGHKSPDTTRIESYSDPLGTKSGNYIIIGHPIIAYIIIGKLSANNEL